MGWFNTGDKCLALLLLSAGHLIVCSHWDRVCPSTAPQSTAVLKGDRHHSENTESFVHNCPFWITGQARCTPTYIQQRAHCNSTALINPYKFTLAKEYVSLLLCWSPCEESWDAHGNLTRVLIGDSSPSMADSFGSAGLGDPQLCKCIIPVRK